MSNQAVLDSDRRVMVIVLAGYTMRDGIIYSDGGADCFQAPEHRGGAVLEDITPAENAKYDAAQEAHRQDRAAWRVEVDAGTSTVEDEPAPPVLYFSEARNVVVTKPKITEAIG